jgi:hypothetical protein
MVKILNVRKTETEKMKKKNNPAKDTDKDAFYIGQQAITRSRLATRLYRVRFFLVPCSLWMTDKQQLRNLAL